MDSLCMGRRALWRFTILLSVIVCGTSCNKDKLQELVDKSKDQINKGVEQAQQQAEQMKHKVSDSASKASDQAQQQLQLAGDMQFTLDAPLKTSACYVKLVSIGAGRPSVLKLKSYRDAKSETFPSVYIHATTDAASVSELRGQTIAAQMWLQPKANGEIWAADAANPVQLKISAIEGKQVTAQVVSGTLTSTSDGKQMPAAGNLNGVLD